MNLWEKFNKPVGKVIDDWAEAKAREIENKNYNQNCVPIITFDRCIQWANKTKQEYGQGSGLVIAVQENPDPKNENDKICVIVALIDENSKAISLDGVNGISTIFHGGTVDAKMLDSLNGNQSVKYMFK